MRLLRVGPPGREKPCALAEDRTARDLSSWVDDWSGDAIEPIALTALAERFRREGNLLPEVALDRVRIGAPVQPGQILSIGLNYRSHAAEVGLELTREPIVASKSPWAVVGPYDDLVIPPHAEKTDWEVELAVVIGRRAQYIPEPGAALAYVAGYCTANDVSERGWLLERGGQWVKGKSFATFAPLGPWLVTKEDVAEPDSLTLTCRVNGKLMQSASTSDMVFDVPYLVYYVSQCMILQPGDVIFTGSPSGVALGRPDHPYLRHGDVVEAEVHGLGAQRQRCRSHRSS